MRASPGSPGQWLRHTADCWALLARLETEAPRLAPSPQRGALSGWVTDPPGQIRKMKLTALDEGWVLEIAGVANSLVFARGIRAKDVALRLGSRLTDAGNPAEVEVYPRGGAFAARFHCIEGEARAPRRRRLSPR